MSSRITKPKPKTIPKTKQQIANESDESEEESEFDESNADSDSENSDDETINVKTYDEDEKNEEDIGDDDIDKNDDDDENDGSGDVDNDEIEQLIISKKNNQEDEDENDENGDLNIDPCLLDENVEENVYIDPVEATCRISFPKLTKYEKVRIVGLRTKQLTLGAPPFVKNVENMEPSEIANIELMMNMIPFKIKRPMPNNTYEIWKISELEK